MPERSVIAPLIWIKQNKISQSKSRTKRISERWLLLNVANEVFSLLIILQIDHPFVNKLWNKCYVIINDDLWIDHMKKLPAETHGQFLFTHCAINLLSLFVFQLPYHYHGFRWLMPPIKEWILQRLQSKPMEKYTML